MKKRYLVSVITLLTLVVYLISSCKKINESTSLGGGLIPPIDNINTFDTLIDVEAYNDLFAFVNDSVRAVPTDEFFLGKITNDPLFGASEAQLFFQLKPSSFPFVFRNKPHQDSLMLDSVVLILDHIGTYGDTLLPQTISVYEMDQSPENSNFRSDSTYLLRYNDFTFGPLLATQTVVPASLKDTVKAFGGDTSAHQLRIKLPDIFGNRLLYYDTLSTSANGAYASDSIFSSKLRGFALKSESGGNALMSFNLASEKTRLAIYYRYANQLPNIDTTVAYFNFGTLSASANYITRDYTGSEFASSDNGPAEDPIVYLQNTPGSFATIKIPALPTLSNRVVHKAELIMEQVADISDSLFPSPGLLYLDAIDPSISGVNKFRTIPYDLSFLSTGGINSTEAGLYPVVKTDITTGNQILSWRINISRYVQHVVNGTLPAYDLRLFPAFRQVQKYGIPPGADIDASIYVNPYAVKGRIRLGGGNHPTQKMKLRLVYSKL